MLLSHGGSAQTNGSTVISAYSDGTTLAISTTTSLNLYPISPTQDFDEIVLLAVVQLARGDPAAEYSRSPF